MLATALLTACAPAIERQSDVPLPAREEFVTQALRHPGDTRTDIAHALGEPDSIAAEIIPNRHVPGVTDTLFTLYYSDLTAHIHRPGPGGEMVSEIDVRDNRHLRYPAIGLRVDALERSFGPPDLRSDSSFIYYCTTCMAADDPVEFIVDGSRVRRIRFHFYVD